MQVDVHELFRHACGRDHDEGTWLRAKGWALALGLAVAAGANDQPVIRSMGLRTLASSIRVEARIRARRAVTYSVKVFGKVFPIGRALGGASSSLGRLGPFSKGDREMDLAKLVTMGFEKNVGTADRIFRVTSGLGLAGSGWLLHLATWQVWLMTVLGIMWTASGALSRCSIYYVLGYSTCPISGKTLRRW